MTIADELTGFVKEEKNRLSSRMTPLHLEIPSAVVVVGVGGVGSWVAYMFSKMPPVERIVLIDPDVVEGHNTTRTPYTFDQIGMLKVEALQDILMRNGAAHRLSVIPIPKKDTDLMPEEIDLIANILALHTPVYIDTTDREAGRETELLRRLTTGDNTHIIHIAGGGYDGLKMTLDYDAFNREVMGDGRIEYRITPSYIVPPIIIASFIVDTIINRYHWATLEKMREESNTNYASFFSGYVHEFFLRAITGGEKYGKKEGEKKDK